MENPSPLFSIITVTRRNIAGLRGTAASLAAQSCNDLEWIVIDGASTDGTREFLAGTNARWTSEPDRGIYHAMNKGTERARGDYLLFLNAGDRLAEPQTLEKLARSIRAQATPPDFVYGDALEEKNYKPARSHKKSLWGMFTHHQAMLYRRKMLRGKRYDERHAIAADYDFTCRVLKETQNILYCPFPVCVFESGGVSQTHAGKGRREQFAIRRELGMGNIFTNAAVYALQTAAWTIRTRAPGLYRLLKSCGSNARGSGQSQDPPRRPEIPS